jgi:hypothetical protein
VDLVNVDGAESAAFRTVATENFFHLPVDYLRRDFLGNAEDISVGEAFLVAETLGAGSQTTHYDG